MKPFFVDVFVGIVTVVLILAITAFSFRFNDMKYPTMILGYSFWVSPLFAVIGLGRTINSLRGKV